ncbi:MAG: lipoic acid synthetase [Armatimonadetes bacterium]|jgi:lipoic acid synthetase|nr:lipoic acid synthetase [Armatimonadota bacterium]
MNELPVLQPRGGCGTRGEVRIGGPLVESAPARPDWLRVRAPFGPNFQDLTRLVDDMRLHTVCQSARCPNIGECWERRAATFMILGDICTRACGFCAIKTGRPLKLDREEPERVAEAVEYLGLRFAVITSVNRDELDDGGAEIFAETIRAIRRRCPETGIEVLIPDFEGNWDALAAVVEARPDILNHNVESIERLYKIVRPQAKYWRSMELLRRVREMDPTIVTKSGMMLGVGEELDETRVAMRHLRDVDCDVLTLGQYLRPSAKHIPLIRYVTPDEFRQLKEDGLQMGFKHVESGPLVRSSYHADEQVPK